MGEWRKPVEFIKGPSRESLKEAFFEGRSNGQKTVQIQVDEMHWHVRLNMLKAEPFWDGPWSFEGELAEVSEVTGPERGKRQSVSAHSYLVRGIYNLSAKRGVIEVYDEHPGPGCL